MRVIQSVREMQDAAGQLRQSGKRIGFVPTMGFLHEGHLSLMRAARKESDVVVVSVFVNPAQFRPGEDFENYPRDFDRDAKRCQGEGVDIVFHPPVDEMYASDHSAYVDETELSKGLCGAARPGHFRGVATVVTKLFNIVQPHVAVFGQKDAQQARVIQQMVADLNIPVRIVVAPTLREPDGLAMSSRNQYLSAAERLAAPCLYHALQLARQLYSGGTRDPERIRREMAALIEGTGSAAIDYLELVDRRTFRPCATADDGTLVVLAVKIGRTRLIDNMIIGGG